MPEVKAQRVATFDQLEEGHKPGQYWMCSCYNPDCGLAFDPQGMAINEDYTALWYNCPCGCGDLGYIPFRKGINADRRPSWLFDENPDCPTLSPSILRTGGCRYHGHLIAGVWKSC